MVIARRPTILIPFLLMPGLPAGMAYPGDAGAGPWSEDTQEILAELEAVARAAERPVQFVQVTPEEYEQGLTQAGLPKDYVSLVMYLLTTVLDGRNEYVADGIRQALGREPRDFADYARETAATGIWAAAPEAAAIAS